HRQRERARAGYVRPGAARGAKGGLMAEPAYADDEDLLKPEEIDPGGLGQFDEERAIEKLAKVGKGPAGMPDATPGPDIAPPDISVDAISGPDKTGTRLSPGEEGNYQAWKASLPKELQYEGDYDLRGFYKKNPNFPETSGQYIND